MPAGADPAERSATPVRTSGGYLAQLERVTRGAPGGRTPTAPTPEGTSEARPFVRATPCGAPVPALRTVASPTEVPLVQTERFAFARQRPWSTILPAAFHAPDRAAVELSDLALSVRFGPFLTTTPWVNVRDVSVSGPYRWFRAIGPRMSLVDRGVTYGTATDRGVCIRFHEPVAGLFGARRLHPGLTVTVEDPEGLAAAVRARLTANPGGPG